LTLAGGSAQAATIAQIMAANPNFQLEDDSVESQNVDLNGDSNLDVGDTLRGIVEFPQLRNLDTTDVVLLAPIAGNSHLSAVFEVEVLTKTQTAGAGTPGDPTDDLFTFTFGVHAAFDDGPDGIDGTADDYAVGTMIAFFEDGVDDVNFGPVSCPTTAACEANVTDGTHILALGFDDLSGDTEKDEAWVANNAIEDPTAATLVSSSTAVGQFNFQLTDLFSSVGDFFENKDTFIPVVGGNGKISWLGSGSVLGTSDLNTIYDVSDDADLTAEVPEPGTLGLMGAGLLALAGFARRRFRKAA
jgi:hypothetical protein